MTFDVVQVNNDTSGVQRKLDPLLILRRRIISTSNNNNNDNNVKQREK